MIKINWNADMRTAWKKWSVEKSPDNDFIFIDGFVFETNSILFLSHIHIRTFVRTHAHINTLTSFDLIFFRLIIVAFGSCTPINCNNSFARTFLSKPNLNLCQVLGVDSVELRRQNKYDWAKYICSNKTHREKNIKRQ